MLTVLLMFGAGASAAGAVRATGRSERSRRLWWVAAGGAALAAAVVASTGAPVPVGSALTGAGLAAAAVVDGAEGRIPTPVAHATAAVAAVALVVHAVLSGDVSGALRAAALTGVLVAACAALWTAGFMGFGDVRLAAGTATAMLGGVQALVVLGWCVAVGVGLVASGRRVLRTGGRGRGDVDARGPVPCAPALAVAWLVAVALA